MFSLFLFLSYKLFQLVRKASIGVSYAVSARYKDEGLSRKGKGGTIAGLGKKHLKTHPDTGVKLKSGRPQKFGPDWREKKQEAAERRGQNQKNLSHPAVRRKSTRTVNRKKAKNARIAVHQARGRRLSTIRPVKMKPLGKILSDFVGFCSVHS